MPSSIPIVICGRIPAHVNGISTILNSQGYKVTHTFSDFAPASTTLSTLVADPSTRPRAIVIGRGFSDEDQDALMKRAATPEGDAGSGVAWLVARPELMTEELKKRIGYHWDGKGPPPVEVLAGRIRESLRARGIEKGGEREGGLERDGVFGF